MYLFNISIILLLEILLFNLNLFQIIIFNLNFLFKILNYFLMFI